MKGFINKNNIKKEIKEIYETYNGDLYFLAEKPNEEGYALTFARLYAMPQFAEWGVVNINYIKKEYGNKIWIVPKRDWENINTYENNLLKVVK